MEWNLSKPLGWDRAMRLYSHIAHAEQAVDLSALGTTDFNPYNIDRNPLWILLPLSILFFVFLHLKKQKRPVLQQPDEVFKDSEV